MSLGGMGYSQTLADAVDYAVQHGVVVVAAAGNSGADVSQFYPASLPGVVTVAATDQYSLPWWNNWGSSIDVTAPGVAILSSLPGNQYQSWSGTSMATPHVSGYAAYLKALHPTLNRFELAAQIESQANRPGGPGWDAHYGYGVLDLSKAANAVDWNAWSLQVEAPAKGIAVSGETPLAVDVNPRLVTSVQVKDEAGHVLANLPNPRGDYLLRGRFDASLLGPGAHTLTFTAYDSHMGALTTRSQSLTVRAPNKTGLQIKVLDPLGRPAKGWISIFHPATYKYIDGDVHVYEYVWSGETNDAGDLQLSNGLLPDGNEFVLYANLSFAGADGSQAFAWYTRNVSVPGRIVLDAINAHPVKINAQRLKDDGTAALMDDAYVLGVAADSLGRPEGFATNAVGTLAGKGSVTVWMEPGTYNLAVVSWTYNHFLYQPQVKVTEKTRNISFGVDQVAQLTFDGDHAPYALAAIALFNGSNLEPMLDVTTHHTVTFTPGYYQAEIIEAPLEKDNVYVYYLVDGYDPLVAGLQPGTLYGPGTRRTLHDGTLIEPVMNNYRSYQVPGTDYFSLNKFATTTGLWLYFGYWSSYAAAESLSQSLAGPMLLHQDPGRQPRLDRMGVPGQASSQQVDLTAMDFGFISPRFTVQGADGTRILQNEDYGNLWSSWWYVPGNQPAALYRGSLDLDRIGPLGGPVHTETGIDVRTDGVTSGLRVTTLGLDGKPMQALIEVMKKITLPNGQPYYNWVGWGFTDSTGIARFQSDPYWIPDGGQYIILAYRGAWDSVTPTAFLAQTVTTPADLVFDARKAQALTVNVKDENGAALSSSAVAATVQDASGVLVDSFFGSYTDGSGQSKLLVSAGNNYEFAAWNFSRSYFLASPTVKVDSSMSSYTIPAGKLARVTVGNQMRPDGSPADYGYFYPIIRNTYIWGSFSPGQTVTLSATTDWELQDLVVSFGATDLWAYWYDAPQSHLNPGDSLTLNYGGPLGASLQPVQAFADKGQFLSYTDVHDPQNNRLIDELGFSFGSDEANMLSGNVDLAHIDIDKLNNSMSEFKRLQARRQLALAMGPGADAVPELPQAQTHFIITPNLQVFDRSGHLVSTVHDYVNNWQYLYWAPPAGTGGTFTARMILPVDSSHNLTLDTPFRLPGLWVDPGMYSPRSGALKIHLDVQQKGTMDIQVQRSDGSAVENIVSSQVLANGSYELTWNGRSNGQFAADGDYQVVAFNQETGQTLTVPFSLKASIPQRPTLDRPATYTNVASLRLTGRTSPGAHVEFWVDGHRVLGGDAVDANGEGAFAGDVLLGADGKHFITAIGYDDYGNRSGYSSTVSTTLDTVAPSITLQHPALGAGASASTDRNSVQLQGSTEGHSSVVLAVTRPDGSMLSRTYSTGYSGSFRDTIALPATGDYQFQLVATDQAGNISSPTTFTVHRNAAP